MRYLPLVLIGLVAIAITSVADTPVAAPADPALERTRKTVRMIDDMYKGGIVVITTNYVNDEDDMPAGIAFKKLFEAAKKNGWHEVRLLDATGEPYNEENAPRKGFEQRGVAKLKAGAPYYDEVTEQDGKRYLHAVTAVPVVMDKCVMCHDNYADAKPGAAIGALGYVVPIE